MSQIADGIGLRVTGIGRELFQQPGGDGTQQTPAKHAREPGLPGLRTEEQVTVRSGSPGFLACEKCRADLYGLGAKGEASGDAAAVRDSSGGNDRHSDGVDHLRDKSQRSMKRILCRPQEGRPVAARYEAGRHDGVDPSVIEGAGLLDGSSRAECEDPCVAASAGHRLRGDAEHEAQHWRPDFKRGFDLSLPVLAEVTGKRRGFHPELSVVGHEADDGSVEGIPGLNQGRATG